MKNILNDSNTDFSNKSISVDNLKVVTDLINNASKIQQSDDQETVSVRQ